MIKRNGRHKDLNYWIEFESSILAERMNLKNKRRIRRDIGKLETNLRKAEREIKRLEGRA
jgi:hypothetical protein